MEKDNQIKFYDGSELLGKKDAEGLDPEIYIVCSRTRSAGKTVWFTRKLFEDYLETGQKFVLFCRNKLELGSVAEGMFKAMLDIFHPQYSMKETIQMKGIYSNILITSGDTEEDKKVEHCGYVIPLASSDNIKRISSMFSDASEGYFDEFQPEAKSTYIPDEVKRFLSIVTSVARGGGATRRRFPVYFSSNTISVNNPYFIELQLNKRIKPDTKWVKGIGYVFQKIENEEIQDEHANAGINRAFRGNKAIDFGDNSWMNDNYSCVESPDKWGRADYYCTLINGKFTYGVKYYPEMRLYYVDYKADKTAGLTFNIKYDDMQPNVHLLKNSLSLITLRNAMEQGIVRFKDIRCKEACMDLFI